MNSDDRTSGHKFIVRHKQGCRQSCRSRHSGLRNGSFHCARQAKESRLPCGFIGFIEQSYQVVKLRLRKSHLPHLPSYQSANAQTSCWTVMVFGIPPMSWGYDPHVVSACPNSCKLHRQDVCRKGNTPMWYYRDRWLACLRRKPPCSRSPGILGGSLAYSKMQLGWGYNNMWVAERSW